jgi:flavin-dependent dehydrogenase
MTAAETYESIVIGAGPAGSTAAAILAENGRRVMVLEKEKFPRYRIGESMIPYCYFPLQRLGLIDKMRSLHFTKKYSVQFVSMAGKVSDPFYFFQHFDHDASTTWQVLRSEFDQILVDNAREKGAEVIEAIRVRDLLQENGAVVGVKAQDENGSVVEFHAPITIDASGRESLSILRNGWRVGDSYLEKVSIWTYYRGAMRDSGLDEGATTIAYLPEKGWFWYVPLPDDLVSVGIVADKDYIYKETRDPEIIFKREVLKNPWIERHLAAGSHDGPYRVTGDYSYRSKYCAANGLVLTGDAFAFLDPVFSSGVFLALLGGELAADAVEAALSAGDVSSQAFIEYGEKVCAGIEAMRKLVYAFYDKEFSFRRLFEKYPDLRSDVTDGLIGNLFKDFDPLFKAVAEFAQVPENLPHGRPYMAEL